jgi:hypothetical protein
MGASTTDADGSGMFDDTLTDDENPFAGIGDGSGGSSGGSNDGFVDRVRDQFSTNIGFVLDPINLGGGVPESITDGIVDTVTPGSAGDEGRPSTGGDLLPEGSWTPGVDDGGSNWGGGGDGSGSDGGGSGGDGGGPFAQLNLLFKALPWIFGFVLFVFVLQGLEPLLDLADGGED